MATNDTLVDELVEHGRIDGPHKDDIEAAFRAVRRSYFYPEGPAEAIYQDGPVLVHSNEYGELHQSAPHMYALVLSQFAMRPGDTFLNVGSGTGYLSAIVAYLVGVDGVNHGVEIRPGNVKFARRGVERFFADTKAILRIHFRHANIFALDTEASQRYTRIYVGASISDEQLESLLPLLDNDGIFIAPVGHRFLRVTRNAAGQDTHEVICPVSYRDIVPKDQSKRFTIVRREDFIKQTSAAAQSGFIDTGSDVASPSALDKRPGYGDGLHVMIAMHARSMCKQAQAIQAALEGHNIVTWVSKLDCDSRASSVKQTSEAIARSKVFVALVNDEFVQDGQCEIDMNVALNLHHLRDPPGAPTIIPVLFPDVELEDESPMGAIVAQHAPVIITPSEVADASLQTAKIVGSILTQLKKQGALPELDQAAPADSDDGQRSDGGFGASRAPFSTRTLVQHLSASVSASQQDAVAGAGAVSVDSDDESNSAGTLSSRGITPDGGAPNATADRGAADDNAHGFEGASTLNTLMQQVLELGPAIAGDGPALGNSQGTEGRSGSRSASSTPQNAGKPHKHARLTSASKYGKLPKVQVQEFTETEVILLVSTLHFPSNVVEAFEENAVDGEVLMQIEEEARAMDSTSGRHGDRHAAYMEDDQLGLKPLQCRKLRNALRRLVPPSTPPE